MNKKISLNGKWKLQYFDIGEGEKKKIFLPLCNEKDWLETVVPGDVHFSSPLNEKIGINLAALY